MRAEARKSLKRLRHQKDTKMLDHEATKVSDTFW
jgi:hypothetical protein